MTVLPGNVGFASPISKKNFSKRRTATIELVATLALAASLIIAATAVSIGVARAQGLGPVTDSDGAPFAIALFLGLVLVGMGVLTAMAANPGRSRRE